MEYWSDGFGGIKIILWRKVAPDGFKRCTSYPFLIPITPTLSVNVINRLPQKSYNFNIL